MALFLLALLSASTGFASPVLDELKQMHVQQESEKNRLAQMQAALPKLTYAQSKQYAGKLAESLNSVLAELAKTSDEAVRSDLLAQARVLLETVSLLSQKIDPNDLKQERTRAYENQVERRRLPVKALFAATGLINTLGQMVKNQMPDFLSAIEEHSLPPYKISDSEWLQVQAQEFIETFKKKLETRSADLHIAPGIDGALKSGDHVLALIGQRRCEVALLGGKR